MEFEINRKQLKIDNELIDICKAIKNENKSDDDWSLIESCDMFQTNKYCGGYEAIEQCFCFSYYEKNIEYWFNFSLADIDKIIDGKLQYLDLQKADA